MTVDISAAVQRQPIFHHIVRVLDRIFSEAELSDSNAEHLALVAEHVSRDDKLKQLLTDYYSQNKNISDDLPYSFNFFMCDLLESDEFLNNLNKYIARLNSIGDFYEVFWNITNRKFVSGGAFGGFSDWVMRAKFDELSSGVKRHLRQRGLLNKKSVAHPKTVAIITPQFLGMRHSPTREAINLSLHLEQYCGCNVFVINTNSMIYENRLSILDGVITNARPDLDGLQQIAVDYLDFKNRPINVLSYPPQRMSTGKILKIVEDLEALGIDAVIAHGENLLVQDALFGSVPSLFASTGAVVPYAHSDAYWVPGNLFSDAAEQKANRLGHSDFMRESMLVTPEGKALEAASRHEFGLSDEHFVFLVVSTRLPAELTGDFVNACHEILATDPRARLVFCGSNGFELQGIFDQSLIDDRVVQNVGFHSDLPSLCAMGDAYLNPFRQGGGTSSQTAILNGMPVVTMDYGHISAVVPADRRHKQWSDYVQYATALMKNPGFSEAEQRKFAEHFSKNLQIRDQVERMYEKLCLVAHDKFSESAVAAAESSPDGLQWAPFGTTKH